MLLWGIVLLAALLRLDDLGQRSLWADEIFSASVAADHPLIPSQGMPWFERLRILDVRLGQSFWTVKAADQSPPLFELAVKLSVALFGLNEFAVRFPSALAGILLVAWLAVSAARGSGRTERAAFAWAALFCAVAPEAVAYGQEARAYSLGMLWSGILTAQWYRRWLHGFGAAASPGWGEVLVFILGCHTHFNLILLSAVLLTAYGWVALRRRDAAAVGRLALVPLACIPWVVMTAHTYLFTMDGGIAWVQMAWYQVVAASIGVTPRLFLWPWLVLALLSLAWFWGVRRAAGDRAARRVLPLAPGLALLGLMLAYLVLLGLMVSRSGIFHYRHLMFLMAALALLAGHLLSPMRPVPALSAGLIALLAASLPARDVPDRSTGNFRAAFEHVLARLEPTAPLVGITPADRRFYVDVLTPGSTRPLILLPAFEDHPEAYDDACQELERLGARQVGVVTHRIRLPFTEALMARCQHRYDVVESKEVGDMLVQLWLRRAGP